MLSAARPRLDHAICTLRSAGEPTHLPDQRPTLSAHAEPISRGKIARCHIVS